MKTLLISDNAALQADLDRALQGLDDFTEVWRTPVPREAAWFLVRDADVDVVFVDLSWCGHQLLPSVINTIHPWLEHTKVVLLLNRLDDLGQPGLRRVRADLCVPRATPPQTFQAVLAETLWGPTQQALAA
jgi:DNA-binding NarL/FixJ family response regulator